MWPPVLLKTKKLYLILFSRFLIIENVSTYCERVVSKQCITFFEKIDVIQSFYL